MKRLSEFILLNHLHQPFGVIAGDERNAFVLLKVFEQRQQLGRVGEVLAFEF